MKNKSGNDKVDDVAKVAVQQTTTTKSSQTTTKSIRSHLDYTLSGAQWIVAKWDSISMNMRFAYILCLSVNVGV